MSKTLLIQPYRYCAIVSHVTFWSCDQQNVLVGKLRQIFKVLSYWLDRWWKCTADHSVLVTV